MAGTNVHNEKQQDTDYSYRYIGGKETEMEHTMGMQVQYHAVIAEICTRSSFVCAMESTRLEDQINSARICHKIRG
jgi:hypothetical protein